MEIYKELTFNKLFWIFFIGCFLGVVIETLWCLLRNKRIESRKGLIYGPFNLVYGFGALVITLSLSWLSDERDLYIFLFGTFVGGAYEYICSFMQEKLLGSVSWNYKKMPLNLHGRINLTYCMFWGILALWWTKDWYPRILYFVSKLPLCYETPLVILCGCFMLFDSFLSACAVYRMSRRLKGISAHSAFGRFIDRHYPDQRMKRIYPNMDFNALNPKLK